MKKPPKKPSKTKEIKRAIGRLKTPSEKIIPNKRGKLKEKLLDIETRDENADFMG